MFKLKLGHKIGAGYLLMALLLIVAGIAGFYGLSQLSNSLDYLAGPAWDTADGSMETRVEIQRQAIAAHNIMANVDVEAQQNIIEEAKGRANEAVERLVAANVASADIATELEQKSADYETKLYTLLTNYTAFAAVRDSFEEHDAQFVRFMDQIENIGDAAVEAYEQDINQSVTWQTGLEERWQAADGSMEARIQFLQQLYWLGEMEAGHVGVDEAQAEINKALTWQEEAAVRMISSGMFDDPANMAGYEELTMSQAYTKMFNTHKRLLVDYIEKFKTFQESELAYEAAAESHLTFLNSVEDVGDAAVEDEKANIAATEQTANIVMSVALVIGLLAALVAGIILTRSITRPVQVVTQAATQLADKDLPQLVRAIQAVAEGDLTATVRLRPNMVDVQSGDEVGQMAGAFNNMNQAMAVMGENFAKMLANLRNLVGQVQQSAVQVASAGRQLNAATDQAGQASQQVATTTQQVAAGTAQQTQSITEATGNAEQMARAAEGIARGAQEQAAGMQKTTDLISEMAGIVEQVGQVAGSVTNANAKVTQAAYHGVAAVDQTSQGMETIRSRATVTAEKVKEMGARSKEIGRIVETIDDIADKTDMLALNAAVEAARAGEHGRGFAVVADQVRKLSEDSKLATRDIDDLIERVQETINEAIAAMESTATEVDNGTRLTGDTAQSLQDILQAAEEAAKMAERIGEAVAQLKKKSEGVVAASETVSAVVEENTAVAEQMAANSQEVTDAMEGVASIAEENSAATEEVSASAEEMAAQIEEVVASAEELAALADELQAATAQFRVNGAGRAKWEQPDSSPKLAAVPVDQPQPQAESAGHSGNGYDVEI